MNKQFFYMIEFTNVAPMISCVRDNVKKTMELAGRAVATHRDGGRIVRVTIWEIDRGLPVIIATEYERK